MSKVKTIKHKRIIVAIMIILVTIVIAIALVVALLSRTRSENEPNLQLEQQLTTEVKNARSTEIAPLHDENEQYIKALASKLNVGQAAYSQSRDTCYIGHYDAGWTVTDYTYNCKVSFITVFEMSAQQVAALREDVTVQVTEPGDIANVIGFYDLASEAGTAGATGFGLASGFDSNTLKTAINKNRNIAYPGVTAYAISQAINNSYELESEIKQPIDTETTYLISSWSKEYYHKNIGCNAVRGYCNVPISEDFMVQP